MGKLEKEEWKLKRREMEERRGELGGKVAGPTLWWWPAKVEEKEEVDGGEWW